MNELEPDTAAPEPAPAPSPAIAAPEDAPTPSEPELEQPPVWEDPNQPDTEAYPEPSEDAWAFLQDTAAEEGAPFEDSEPPGSALERAWVGGLFKPNSAQFLGLVERALRALPRSKPRARFLTLVSRAREANVSEPRLVEQLLRAQADGQVTDDFGLLAALLARRLVLPSLRVEPRATAAPLRLRLLRELRTLAQRVSRARGDEGLRELAQSSTRLGARASERGQALEELMPLLRRRFERSEPTPPALEAQARGSRRPRRFRLPGRVEIVIYEE